MSMFLIKLKISTRMALAFGLIAFMIIAGTVTAEFTLAKLGRGWETYDARATAAKVREMTSLVDDTMVYLTVAAILAILIVAAIGFFLTSSITGPLAKAANYANRVAEGDLTANVDVRSNTEIGKLMQALRGMIAGLNRIVQDVRSGADSIAAASKEIASGNTDLSQRTEEQASGLEETASSIEELTATVKQNADNAEAANVLVREASAVASKGGEVVGRVVQTMGGINQSSQKIADIIGVVDSIAFQTNILALNAAVEAARAGEQGRGFAVVAGEVRSLAQRSAQAAKEIKALIGDSVKKVGDGTRLVDEAGATMQDIAARVEKVTAIIAEIAAASQEQRAGIEQVNHAIMQMDKVTQQNAALVEQSSAAAESMQMQAAKLADAVRTFRIHAGASPMPEAGTTPVPTPAPAKPDRRKTLPALKLALSLPHGSADHDGWRRF